MLKTIANFDRIGEENAFTVLARAAALAAQGRDIISLGIGQPDFRTPDHIVGILRVKDLVERYVTDGPAPLESLIRPLVQIPESLSADRVVSELREKRVHAAIVVDTAGTPIGLITIQDLLEELLGQRPSPVDRPAGRQTSGDHA